MSPFEVSDTANVGYGASETSSGSRIVVKLADLPQTINVVTRELIDDMEVDTPLDAMTKIAPGTSNHSGNSGVNVMIRGFRAQNWAIDGATSRYRSIINNYLFDSIEVIKGPSTLLFGPFGSYGGYVNASAKYAGKDTTNKVFAAVGTDNHYAGMVDVGGALGGADDAWYRMVLAHHNEDRAGIDYDYTTYTALAPSFAFEISESSKIKVRFEYLDSEQKHGRAAFDVNGDLLDSFSASGPLDLTKHKNRSLGMQAIFETLLNEELSARINFSAQYLKDDPLVTGVLTGNSLAQIYNFQATPITTTQVGVYADLSVAWSKKNFGPDGSMSNDLVFGAEINYWNLENIIYDTVRYPESKVAPLDPSNPDWSGLDFDTPYPTRYTPYNIEWLGGAFLQENLSLMHGKLLLSSGVKWNYDARTNQVQQLDVVSPDGVMVGDPAPYAIERTPTYRYGIVFKPVETVSLYAGHTESYISGAGANRKADGSQLDPQSGENDEIGIKVDIPGKWKGVLSGSVSYFQTEVTNIWRGDPDNPGFFVQDGVQENEGLEAQLTYGGPMLSWVIGYYDAEGPITTSDPNKPYSPYAPQRTFNFWGKYNLTERLAIGGGYRYQSETQSNRQDGMVTDPFDTIDLFATYTMPAGDGILRYRVGVSNLTDERAAYRINRPSDVFIIDGRRIKASVTYSW